MIWTPITFIIFYYHLIQLFSFKLIKRQGHDISTDNTTEVTSRTLQTGCEKQWGWNHSYFIYLSTSCHRSVAVKCLISVYFIFLLSFIPGALTTGSHSSESLLKGKNFGVKSGAAVFLKGVVSKRYLCVTKDGQVYSVSDWNTLNIILTVK